MSTLDYIVILVYFIVMILIGLWAMRRVKGQEDYFMGGRGFGKIMQTFAAFGAGTGAHEPVTVGRTGWTSGLSGVWSALMWLFVTPLYWITGVWYRRMRHLTLGDWFVERYESRAMGAAYALFTIIFYMFYLSTMFSAIAKFAVPLLNADPAQTEMIGYILIPIIAAVVMAYGVMGGLTAAYVTDLIQGVFIILLSVMLIPYGLWALVAKFGDPKTQGLIDGFSILHDRVSPDFFSLFSGPAAGEFPVEYIVSLTLLALVGIVVQPHFIVTGGGSAKSEDEARIGLVTGNFLKRLCTIGWALTALIALALLADNPEIAADPDQVWGVASREILGPLNLGLVGLMLSCLLAAVMSSADSYMLVTSGVVVRNLWAAYIERNASEKRYLLVARLSGAIMIVGAAIVAMTLADVFGQFKLAIEIPLVFAAPFWVGMFWRRANTKAAWMTMAYVVVVFFIMPYLLPVLSPGMRSDPALTAETNIVTSTTTRPATAADVARHDAWEQAVVNAKTDHADAERLAAVLGKIGAEPPVGEVGDNIEVVTRSGGVSIYWRGGLDVKGDVQLETISESVEGKRAILVQKKTGAVTGAVTGQGSFNIDFLIYHWLGMGDDLSQASKGTLEALRLPPRLITPFLVLIVLSFLTKPNSKEALDRYYVKMKTEVKPNPEDDCREMEASYANPQRFDDRRLFPKTQLEFVRPRPKDVIGFLVCIVICLAIIGLLMWLATLGA
jgi:solute:Na+ symporter, SSS family